MASDDKDNEILERFFPLISAWGDAIEKGRDAAVPLAALMKESQRCPNDMITAIALVMEYNLNLARKRDVPKGVDKNDIDMAANRWYRLEELRRKLRNSEKLHSPNIDR